MIWSFIVDWLQHHPDEDQDEEYDRISAQHLHRQSRRAAENIAHFEEAPIPAEVIRVDHDLEEEVEPSFYDFRKLLVRHYKEAKARHEVHWL